MAEPKANAATTGEMAQRYGQGKLKPDTDHSMPIADLKAACALGSRGAMGKLVLVN